MYKSPLEIIANAGEMIGIEFDENVMKLVARYGIRIDKEELLKALQYDRDQYRKGFEDGWIASQKAAVPVVVIKNYLQEKLNEWNSLGDRKYEPENVWGYNFIMACFDDIERRSEDDR